MHQNRLRALARIGRKISAQNLTTFKAKRRAATLVAVVLDLEVKLTDEVLTMSDELLGAVWRRGKSRRQLALDDSRVALDDKMRILTELGESLLRAKEQGDSLDKAVEAVVPWEKLAELIDQSRQLRQATAPSVLPYLDPSYGHIRKYAPALFETFAFSGVAAVKPLLEAISVLRTLNRSRGRKLPDDAPTSFITPKWHPLVFKDEGIDRHFYEFAVLSGLRDGLRAVAATAASRTTSWPQSRSVLPLSASLGCSLYRPIAMPA